MELKNTVEMMESTDYKERFKAEYYQLAIRYKKLAAMLEQWDNGTLPFSPTCPRFLYYFQIRSMLEYICALRARATLEHIELPDDL